MSDKSQTGPEATDSSALGDLDPKTYGELRRIASRLARRGAHSSLTATALLHDVWIKLRQAGNLRVTSRAHLAALVVKTAREVITDALRKRLARKRNVEGFVDVRLDDLPVRQVSAELLLQIGEALEALERKDTRMARLFEARYFARMTVAEIAEEFDIPVRSVERSLEFSRAWFGARIRSSRPGGDVRS